MLLWLLMAESALAQAPAPPPATPPPAAEPPPAAPPPATEPPPAEAAPLEAGQLSKLPKQTKFVEAEYPKEALEKGITADVVLLLDINAEGKVDAVGIAVPAEPPGLGFDEAAMIAAQQFEFEPAEMDGQPIAVQIEYRYRFTLTPKVAPPPAPGEAPVEATRQPVVNFSGVLRERGTRLPLPGVIVTVFREVDGKPVGFEATSDAEGRFAFYDLAPGEWKVLVEIPGYYPFKTSEEVREGEAIDATFYVERTSNNPFDVMVRAPRPKKEVSRTIISAEEVEKVPGAMGDPLGVVQNFAGVARNTFGNLPIVRGSAPEDTRIFIDGAEVPLIYHFGGLRSTVPVGLLDSIEFYPGNFSPFYGRATGGIIDVQIKKLEPKKVGGYLDVSLLDSGVFLEVPISDKAAFAVAGRRSYIDFILNATVPDDAPVDFVTAPRYYDYQLIGNYRPAPAHDLRAFFFGSDDRLELLFQNPGEASTELTDNALSTSSTYYRSLLTYRYVPSERFENTLRLAQGRNWIKFNAGRFVFDLDFYSAQVRDTVRQKLTDKVTLTYGLDFEYGRSDFFVRLPAPPKEGEPIGPFDQQEVLTSGDENVEIWEPAGFIEAELELVPGLLLLPGLRVDYHDLVEEVSAQPRLTARYAFNETVTVKGGVGLYTQEPTFDEVDEFFGNPKLERERAMHYSVGAEYKPAEFVTLDGTLFYKDLREVVSQTDRLVVDDGVARPLRYDNEGRGRVMGFELVARHDFHNNFTGWLAYTLSRAERRDSGSQDYRLFDFDQTHILTAVANYSLPRNWQVGARMRVVTGNPRTPVVDSVFNSVADRYDPVYGDVNSDRNPTFHQLDLRVDKRWVYESWMLGVYIDVQNVYSQNNTEALEYNFDYSRSVPATGLPILTILGIQAEF